MASHDGAIQIRSYHKCFRLERRLHKIERWRLPVPYGIPVRSIVYASGLLVAVLVLSELPITGDLLGVLHPWFRFVVIPGGAAWALTRWKVDGRSAPAAGAAWLRWRCSPQRLAAFRHAPDQGETRLDEVTVAPDEHASRLRSGVVRGPGTVVLRYPVSADARGRTLHVRQDGHEPLWRGTQVELSASQRMVIG
jgi:hypothetical protein